MAARDLRMEAENELSRVRRRLELALEGGRVSVWDADLRSGEIFFSQGWNALLGGDPAVTHAGIQAVLALVHPDDVVGLLQAQVAMLKGSRPDYEVALRVRHRSGEWCWVRSRGRVTERGPDGRALRTSGTNWDVTEEMRTAERLRESEASYRRLSSLTSEVYWEQDAELRFTRIEGSAAVRLPSGHYLGKRRWETGCAGVSEAAWRAHRADLEARRPFRDFQLAQVLPDGRTVHLSVSGEPVFDDEGRFAGYRGVATDVTARRQAEEMRRRESEDFARAVFNSLQAAIAVLDAHGVVTAVNDAWRRLALENVADAANREPVGQGYLEASARALSVEGDAAARALEGIAGVLDGSHARFEMEYACHSPDAPRWYAITVLPLAGERGGALVAHANITERKGAETALAESEERFAKLFRSSPVAHALLCADSGRYIEVNAAWERIFGWSRGEALGRSSVEVGVWASEADHQAFLRRFSANGYVREERGRRRRRSGEVFEAIVSAEPLELSGRRYRLTSVMDIDAEARALDALTRSEARFSALFRSSPVPIALVDLEADRYVDVNEAWQNTFKHPRQEVVGRPPEMVGLWRDDETRDRFLRALRQRSAVQGFSATLRDALGTPVAARVFSVRVEIGGRAHALTSCVDVTSETRALNQVRRLNAELERRVVERTAKLEDALAELESFSYSVSHDLRAPARAVAGFSRVVLEDYGQSLPEEGRLLLARISRAGEAMGAMVDGLLELSRISREETQRRPVDLAVLAREVWRDLATLEPERDMPLHIEGPLRAEGDPILLRNLLLNLLGNARKYTRGRPGAAAWLGRSTQGEYHVRDNGVGFDPAHAGKLFQAFQRLHTEREFEGHGIGLALCRRIVERHGGRIRAEAAPGEGATFYFSLR